MSIRSAGWPPTSIQGPMSSTTSSSAWATLRIDMNLPRSHSGYSHSRRPPSPIVFNRSFGGSSAIAGSSRRRRDHLALRGFGVRRGLAAEIVDIETHGVELFVREQLAPRDHALRRDAVVDDLEDPGAGIAVDCIIVGEVGADLSAAVRRVASGTPRRVDRLATRQDVARFELAQLVFGGQHLRRMQALPLLHLG